MITKRIFVVPGRIRYNRDNPGEEQRAPIVVEYSGHIVYASTVEVLGPSRVVYDTDRCRVWIETDERLLIDGSPEE